MRIDAKKEAGRIVRKRKWQPRDNLRAVVIAYMLPPEEKELRDKVFDKMDAASAALPPEKQQEIRHYAGTIEAYITARHAASYKGARFMLAHVQRTDCLYEVIRTEEYIRSLDTPEAKEKAGKALYGVDKLLSPEEEEMRESLVMNWREAIQALTWLLAADRFLKLLVEETGVTEMLEWAEDIDYFEDCVRTANRYADKLERMCTEEEAVRLRAVFERIDMLDAAPDPAVVEHVRQIIRQAQGDRGVPDVIGDYTQVIYLLMRSSIYAVQENIYG